MAAVVAIPSLTNKGIKMRILFNQRRGVVERACMSR